MKKAATVITATLVAVFFSGLANAGRVSVPTRSGSASTVASAIASRAGDIVSSGVIEGTFIPGYQQDRQIPVKVLNSNDFSARRTFEAATNILKTRGPTAAAVAGAAAVVWAADQVGGFIDDQQQAVKKPVPATDTNVYWGNNSSYFSSKPQESCTLQAAKEFPGKTYTFVKDWQYPDQNVCVSGGSSFQLAKKSCTSGTGFNPTTRLCEAGYTGGTGKPEPFTQSDWDKLQQAMNNASGSNTAGDPNFIRDLIRASCEGSLAPQRCYDSLASNAPGSASQHLSGPSSVTSPGTSSITVSKDKDGNATSTTTNSSTTFNITYGNNYYNYSSVTTKNKTNPDGSTETTKEEDPEEDATKYPAQPDALTPVIKEYDKITQSLKTQETVDGASPAAWFSFGGGCSELDFQSPIGHVKTNWCPTIEGYVKPCLGFLFSLGTFIYIFHLWRETTMEVRPT